jgi:hypothetical protein
MSRIYTDMNGVYTNAIHEAEGKPTQGHLYVTTAGTDVQTTRFQMGPVKEHGVNGTTNEHLIAILIDRIGFLNTQFASPHNEKALGHLQMALAALEARTAERLARQVEGTSNA